MKSLDEIKKSAIKTLKSEAEAIDNLSHFIDNEFAECVKLIYASKGRVVITGIGKSAIIANKIVATLNSTGTPAIFMHAADAIHGDLGILQEDDVLICLSKSGNTSEIKVLIPLVKNMGNKMIAITGNVQSQLAQQADFVLNATVSQEACPNNLAPTSSTTAQLAIGDALAVCLLECKGFSNKDFARFHPGGSLGKQLYLRVADVYKHNEVPRVSPDDSLKSVIVEISSKRLGATAVLSANNELKGVITDGDLRRMLEHSGDVNTLTAKDIMNTSPKTIASSAMAAKALEIMEDHNITQLLVTEQDKYAGIIHLHDLIKEGIL